MKEYKPEASGKKQISRRDFLKASGAIVASAVLFNSLVSCSSKTSTETSITTTETPTTATETPTTTTETPTTTSTTTSTTSPKILKVGVATWFGSDAMLDMMKALKLMADQDNENGGLSVGTDRYKVQLIEYDTNNNQTGEGAAVNRLVFEDKVKFLLGESTFINSWSSITEANKVIVLQWNPTLMMTPNLHYTFDGAANNAQVSVCSGWFAKNYPDAVKNIVLAFPDNQIGHVISQFLGASWKAFGVTPNNIFYPAASQDMSSIATKVMSLNPAAFTTMSGSDSQDGLVYTAVRQAGFKGILFSGSFASTQTLKTLIDPNALEGFICGALPTEFDPPLTQMAKDFKASWIAKNGQWNSPNIGYTASYSCMKNALQASGSLDADQIATTISSGLKYESPIGTVQMISRPDVGNNKTVDSVSTYYIKQVINGQAKLIATISTDEALSYFRLANPPLPPGATLPGPPSGPPP